MKLGKIKVASCGFWVLCLLVVPLDCFGSTMSAQLQRYFNSVGGGANTTGLVLIKPSSGLLQWRIVLWA